MNTLSPTIAPDTVSIGYYLAARLREIGVGHLFGLPGDFNLGLLDEMLSVDGVEWVGTTNELNGAYAADGYARMRRGAGALVTTYGVGELSAINGIAGSFAESVPVVHVVGMPTTSAQAAGSLLHHTLADGDFEHFVRAAAEVTATAVVVRQTGATSTIDRTLLAAINSSKPVYLGVPADVARMQVPRRTLHRPLRPRLSDPLQLAAFRESLRMALDSVTDITMLVGPLVHRRELEPVVRGIAGHAGVHIATQNAAKAILDESHPANLGVYSGEHTVARATRVAIDEAAPLILAGAVMTDFLTGFFTHRFDPDEAISLRLDEARIGAEVFYDVDLDDSLRALAEIVAERETLDDFVAHTSSHPTDAPPIDFGSNLDHAVLWPNIESWLRPGTTVIAEAGTAFYGSVGLTLPDDCELLGQPVWSSIGYTLPALLGAMIARPDRESVLIIGDGSAQLTIQELGTILSRGLTPTILLLDNGGYTVERLILSPDAPYQDVVAWDWTALPSAFGSLTTRTFSVSTPGELQQALAQADGSTATFIHVVLPRDDAPELLNRIAVGVR